MRRWLPEMRPNSYSLPSPPGELTAYLAASPIAAAATIHRHGTPHLTPNWYRYDGQVLTLITRQDRLKSRNLQ
jgi:hypothetical protein